MSKRICLNCKGTKIKKDKYIEDGSDCFVCTDCCRMGTAKEFPEMTVFHAITASPEVLAEKLVYETQEFFYDDDNKPIPNHTYYVSLLLVSEVTGGKIYFETREQAIAATVARLKEVCK